MPSVSRDQILLYWFQWMFDRVPEGVTLVKAEAPDPRPPRPYITYKLLSGPVSRGHDEQRKEANGSYSRGGPRAYTLTLNAFGMDAHDILADLQTHLDTDSGVHDLCKNGIAVVERGAVVDLSALVETKFESRANIDIIFSVVQSVDEGLATIQKVRISGTLEDSQGNESQVPGFDVPES